MKTDTQLITDAMAESVCVHMKRQGVNATQLSAMTGIRYPTLLRRLKARTWFTVDEVFDIAHALEVDVVELMTPSFEAGKARAAARAARSVESDQDVAHQVRQTLGGEVEDFDVEGITTAIIARFGLVDVAELDTQDYWEIVKAHDITGGGENK